jgi:hypothetical protein
VRFLYLKQPISARLFPLGGRCLVSSTFGSITSRTNLSKPSPEHGYSIAVVPVEMWYFREFPTIRAIVADVR